jgi:hypothetical protein
MRKVLALFVILTAVAVTTSGVQWEEVSVTTTPTGDADDPAVTFVLHLRYDEAPARADLSYGWTVYEGTGAARSEIFSFYRATTFPGGGLNLYLGSGRVPIEPGRHYVARVTVDDTRNGLHFERDVEYVAQLSFPVGIRLTAPSGEQGFDLSGVPDEEIEEMATAYDVLRRSYQLVAEDVTLEAFFLTYAAASDDFPASVFLIPALGLESEFTSSAGTALLTVEMVLYIYPVPDRSAGQALLDQLAVYEHDFVGRVLEGDGAEAVFGARTVFVGDDAWDVLAAAAAEEDRR